MASKTRKPAIEGWFDIDSERLLGTRCTECGTVYFPREETLCRNPRCASTKLEETPLSNRGRVWSFTNSCYAPPAPYMAADPFEPITIAAVELEAEKMVILGQMEGAGVEDLEAGMEVELSMGTLFEDDDHEYIIWKWKRAAA